MKRCMNFTAPAALALAMAACGGTEATDQVGTEQSALSNGRIHVMKKSVPGPIQTHALGAHLTNYGGPVLTHVQVIPVYWNSGVAYRTYLNGLYSTIPASSTIYTSLLTQYSSIGTGSRVTSFVDTKPGGTFSDAQVQAELIALINAGKIPAPNDNTYYPVHFPAGTTIMDTSSPPEASCTTWCAYHGTFTLNGVNVNYGIIPDQGGGCAGGCGPNTQRVNNLTSVSSHELVEATTDPAVGLATDYAPPLAWYDPVNGEIGDICNAQQATISGYVVQKEWSNSKNLCTTN